MLKSLFLIVWMESELFGWEKNINTVTMLLNKAQIDDNPKVSSELDDIFDELVLRTVDVPGKGDMHRHGLLIIRSWLARRIQSGRS